MYLNMLVSILCEGYLEGELQRWHDGYNDVYVNVVEYRLSEAFTTFKKTKDDDFVKKSINRFAVLQ